jgi:hypothetical protein
MMVPAQYLQTQYLVARTLEPGTVTELHRHGHVSTQHAAAVQHVFARVVPRLEPQLKLEHDATCVCGHTPHNISHDSCTPPMCPLLRRITVVAHVGRSPICRALIAGCRQALKTSQAACTAAEGRLDKLTVSAPSCAWLMRCLACVCCCSVATP